MTTLQERIETALLRVRDPRSGADVLTAEKVRDIATSTAGRVRLTLLLSAGDNPELARDVRRALEGVEGVTEVRVDVREADAAQAAPRPAASSKRSLPVMDARPAPARPSAPTPVAYPNLGTIIAVSSGKGGVGKTTVSTNLAVALAKKGARVGLMDAAIYGPNVQRMLVVDI